MLRHQRRKLLDGNPCTAVHGAAHRGLDGDYVGGLASHTVTHSVAGCVVLVVTAEPIYVLSVLILHLHLQLHVLVLHDPQLLLTTDLAPQRHRIVQVSKHLHRLSPLLKLDLLHCLFEKFTRRGNTDNHPQARILTFKRVPQQTR